MELIKQIKQAEAQAKEIVEQARSATAKIAEQTREKQVQMLAAAEAERKEAIKSAVNRAEQTGAGEIESLKKQSAEQIGQVEQNAQAKLEGCAVKVLEHLREMG